MSRGIKKRIVVGSLSAAGSDPSLLTFQHCSHIAWHPGTLAPRHMFPSPSSHFPLPGPGLPSEDSSSEFHATGWHSSRLKHPEDLHTSAPEKLSVSMLFLDFSTKEASVQTCVFSFLLCFHSFYLSLPPSLLSFLLLLSPLPSSLSIPKASFFFVKCSHFPSQHSFPHLLDHHLAEQRKGKGCTYP